MPSGKATPQLIAHAVQVGAWLELDLDRGDGRLARERVDHAAQILQLAKRHEGEARIVLAHLAFIEIDHGELRIDRLGGSARGRERHLHIVSRAAEVEIAHSAFGVARLGAHNGDAENKPRALLLHFVERRLVAVLLGAALGEGILRGHLVGFGFGQRRGGRGQQRVVEPQRVPLGTQRLLLAALALL
jgi:hypothetical protein